MSPMLALAAFLAVAVFGFVGAWLYDRRLRSFPHDVLTRKLYRAGNLNVHLTVALLVILQCAAYGGEETGVQCHTEHSDIKFSSRKGKVWVTAKAWCEPGKRPVDNDLFVELQWLTGGKWMRQVDGHTSTKPGTTKRNTKARVKVETDCVPGEWQALGNVIYTDRKGTIRSENVFKVQRVIANDAC